MSQASVFTGALACVFLLGACSDDPSQLPTAEDPAFLTDGGPVCSPTDLRKATEAFFGKRSPEVAYAAEFKRSTVNTSAVTSAAYALFDAIADRRDATTWSSGDVEAAADLSVHIAACADLVFTEPDLPGADGALLDAFTAALGAAGTYQVRGNGNEAAVLSDDAQAGLVAPTTFAAWFGGAGLVLGHPTTLFAIERSGEVAYDWFMLRPRGAIALTGQATVSLCTVTDFLDSDGLRLQHLPALEGGNIIPLAPAPAPVDCLSDFGSRPATIGGRILAALEAALIPEPLHAAVARGPVGGLLGSFSPVEAVFPDQVLVSFTKEPVDGFVNTAIPVEVKVTGANLTPWEGVTVVLSPVANSGTPLTLCGNSVETNAQGIASFPDFRGSSPGGLFVIASVVEVDDDPDVTAYYDTAVADSSGRFNIRPTNEVGDACPEP